jgi:hypothetical protein
MSDERKSRIEISDGKKFRIEMSDKIVINNNKGQGYEIILFNPCKHTSNSSSSFAVANT